MAFNRQTFITRTSTALVFAAVMLGGLLWNNWSFLVLFSIIHFGCWWEYLKLTEKVHTTSFHVYTKLGLMVMGFGLMLWFCGPGYHINNYSLKENLSLPVSAAGFALLLFGIFQRNSISLKGFGMAMLGLIYISLCWGLMMDLLNVPFNKTTIKAEERLYAIFLPLILIATMWINDTMAYIVGSLIGKNSLTKISPKKTWEGTIGGIILSSIIVGYPAWALDERFVFHKGLFEWIIFVLIIAVAGTFGDLLESKLKRMAQVKDSGALMPGHGGFLDRFDSLLLATPFAWLYIELFMK